MRIVNGDQEAGQCLEVKSWKVSSDAISALCIELETVHRVLE